MYDKAMKQKWGEDMIDHALRLGAIVKRTGKPQTYEGGFEFDNPWGVSIRMDWSDMEDRPLSHDICQCGKCSPCMRRRIKALENDVSELRSMIVKLKSKRKKKE